MGTSDEDFDNINELQVGDRDNYTHTLVGKKVVKRTLDQSFLLQVIMDTVPGHSIISFNGHNDSVGTSEETLWHEGGLVVFPAAATTMTVSSGDANDTSAGTGARTVLIVGLDADYLEIQEVITLSGQTEVTTTNSYLRINFVIVTTAGSGGVNAGHIYIGTGTVTSGKPAVVINFADPGNNLSDAGFFTIPAAKNAYVLNAIFTGTGNKTAELAVYTSVAGGVFLRVAEFDLDNGPVTLANIVPFRKLAPKTDIELRTVAGQTADVKAFVTLLLADQ